MSPHVAVNSGNSQSSVGTLHAQANDAIEEQFDNLGLDPEEPVWNLSDEGKLTHL